MGGPDERRSLLAKNLPGHAAAFGLFLALACVQLWPLPVHLFDGLIENIPGEIPRSDLSIFIWDFWWVKKALVGLHQSPVVCDWIGRPGPGEFVFPTLSLANSLAALGLSGFCSLESSYNILILAILALTGWSAYLLVFDMTGSWAAAVLAGVFYGTTPLQVRHAAQINVFTLFWMPLALLAARRFLATGRLGWAVGFGFCFLANMLSSWYHGIALGLLVAAFSAVEIHRCRSEKFRHLERKMRPLIVAVVVGYFVGGQFYIYVHFAFWFSLIAYFLVLLYISQQGRALQRLVRRLTMGAGILALSVLPVAAPMYKIVQRQPWLRDTPLWAKAVFSADLASYLMPAQWVERLFAAPPVEGGEVLGPQTRGTRDVFPGFVAWALIAAALAWRLRRGRRGLKWLFLAGCFVVLSLGPVLKLGGLIVWEINPAKRFVLPAMLFEFIGVFEGIRAFLRFAFTAYLCAAVFVGVQAADLIESVVSPRARRWIGAALGGAACLLVVERADLPRPVGRVPELPAFEWLRKQKGGVVLLCPVVHNQYENLYLQTRHEKPMINPYVKRDPRDLREMVAGDPFLDFLERPSAAGARLIAAEHPDVLRAAWAKLKPDWIVVDRFAYKPQSLGSIERVLSKALGLRLVYGDERYRIYAQTPAPPKGRTAKKGAEGAGSKKGAF